MRFYFLSILLVSLTFQLQAQVRLIDIESTDLVIESMDNGVQHLSQTGGINNPQFQNADLNGDGKEELYVFDRDGKVHFAFVEDAQTSNGWRLDPSLTQDWPQCTSFVVLRDYNSDGVVDLFTYKNESGKAGFLVYKGELTAANRIFFKELYFDERESSLLHFQKSADVWKHVYTAVTDIPSIEDYDGDGDLDIVSFEVAGSYMDYYENVIEQYPNHTEPFLFRRQSQCFGGVYESNLDGTILLASQAGDCATPLKTDENQKVSLHPGSTICGSDLNGDGHLDLLLGDLSSNEITAVYNTPVNGEVYFSSLTVKWPRGSNEPVAVNNFPGTYHLTKGYLGQSGNFYVASPSVPGADENDFVAWLYKQDSSQKDQFDLLTKSFLSDRSWDHGKGAHPAIGDLSGDGIDDILVGNDYYYNGGMKFSKFSYYEYERGAFKEKNPIWLQTLNNYVRDVLFSVTPTLLDVDADGDIDLIFGNDVGTVAFAENKALSPSSPMKIDNIISKWFGIKVGVLSSPTLGDVSGDGVPDLLVGERSGKLNYFKNKGSRTNPNFESSPSTVQYAGIDVRIPGFTSVELRPTFFEKGGQKYLAIGTRQGRLLIYSDLPNDPNGLASLKKEYSKNLGNGLSPSVGLTSNNKTTMLVGSSRGGAKGFYFENTVSAVDVLPQETLYRANPNPTRGIFSIEGVTGNPSIVIWSVTGGLNYKGPYEQRPILQSGVYHIQVVNDVHKAQVVKLVVLR